MGNGVPARVLRAAAVVAVLASAFGVAPAAADERITAGGGNRYLTPSPTMDQGERLTFANQDFARHDVTARGRNAAGRPLFTTPLIGAGQEAFVEGSQFLTTGTYEFFCTVHPSMVGNLTVTSAGTPQTPPGGGDPPAADVAVNARIADSRLSRVVRRRALNVVISVSGAASVRAVATARIRGRSIRLGSEQVDFPGESRGTFSIPVSRTGRARLARADSARVTVALRATSPSGGSDTATVSRTLR